MGDHCYCCSSSDPALVFMATAPDSSTPSIPPAIKEHLTCLEQGHTRIEGLLHHILAHLQCQDPPSTPAPTSPTAPACAKSPPSPPTSSVLHRSYTRPKLPCQLQHFLFYFHHFVFWLSSICTFYFIFNKGHLPCCFCTQTSIQWILFYGILFLFSLVIFNSFNLFLHQDLRRSGAVLAPTIRSLDTRIIHCLHPPN